jgi:hypothetical protein
MKPRHAAVLALVGWYLMTPPLSGRPGSYVVSRGIPLSQWRVEQSFDSATECEQARLENVAKVRQLVEKAGHQNPGDDVLVQDAALGKCISTDDPRLKGNQDPRITKPAPVSMSKKRSLSWYGSKKGGVMQHQHNDAICSQFSFRRFLQTLYRKSSSGPSPFPAHTVFIPTSACRCTLLLVILELILFTSSFFARSAGAWADTTNPGDNRPVRGSLTSREFARSPLMDENFLTMGGTLDPKISFSRASSATLVRSNALIQSTGIDSPRFDYDPAALTLNGLLLEQGTTNQQLDSSFNIFSGGIYRWYQTEALLTFSSALAPDGTTTAATVGDNAANSPHQVHYVNGVFPVGLNPNVPFYLWPTGGPQVETCSMFFQAGTLSFARLELYENAIGAGVAVDIDLHAGTLANGGTIGSGATYLGSTIKAYSNGIYRVSVSGNIPDPHNLSCSPLTEDSLGNFSYAGSGGTISVWGADLENNPIPTSYFYTASVPNLQLDSNNFSFWDSGPGPSACGTRFPCNSIITVNAGTAPDGSLTAAELADDSTFGDHLTNHPFGLGGPAAMATVGSDYATVTCSEFFKEGTQRYAQLQCGTEGSSTVNGDVNSGISVDIDLQNGTIANGGTYGVAGTDQTTYLSSSIEAPPNAQFPGAPPGWYRVSVTGIVIIEADLHIQSLLANSLGNISYAGTGSTIFIWGPQVEQNQTATLSNYVAVGEIPLGATTRAPDVATQPLVPIRSSGLSWVVSAITASAIAGTQVAAELDDGTGSNRITLQRASDGHLRFLIVSGGAEQATLDLGSVGSSVAFRAGVNAGHGSFAASLNGSPPVKTTGSLPASLTSVRYGSDMLGDYWNGWLRESEVWSPKLSNPQLRNETAKAP